MLYRFAVYTDKGLVKNTNQDSLIVMEGQFHNENVFFAAIADGMGGLSSGEKASDAVIGSLEAWFESDLPSLLDKSVLSRDKLIGSLSVVISRIDKKIAAMGTAAGQECGTTLTGLLIYKETWYSINVGDTRLYQLREGCLTQLTKDHSYVQREIDKGRLTASEAEHHKMRNVLLQCIGAGVKLTPDYNNGSVCLDDLYFLCSDGYRHKISAQELTQVLEMARTDDESEMSQILSVCAEKIMSRGEKDNLSAIIIHIGGKDA